MENERKIKLIKLVTAERKLSKEPNIYINNRNEKNHNMVKKQNCVIWIRTPSF